MCSKGNFSQGSGIVVVTRLADNKTSKVNKLGTWLKLDGF